MHGGAGRWVWGLRPSPHEAWGALPAPSSAQRCRWAVRSHRTLPPSAFVPLAASGRCPPAPRLPRQQRVFHLPGAWGLPGLGVARSPPRESPQAAASRPRPPGMPGGGVGAAACVTRPEFQPFCLRLPITAGGSDRPGAFEGTSAQPSAPGAGAGRHRGSAMRGPRPPGRLPLAPSSGHAAASGPCGACPRLGESGSFQQ